MTSQLADGKWQMEKGCIEEEGGGGEGTSWNS